MPLSIVLIYLSVSVFFLITSLLKIPLGLSSKSWPDVKGTIISSEMKRYEGGAYEYRIQYSFEVLGKEYTSNSINAAPGWVNSGNIKALVEKKVARYPTGSEVSVYYNPESRKYCS